MFSAKQRVDLRPLKSIAKRFDKVEKKLTKKAIKELAKAGLEKITEAQKKSTKKGFRIRKGVYFTIGARSVTFHLSQIGAYHNFGVRKHKMRYLLKTPNIIVPIKAKWGPDRGKTIFRTVTKRSMNNPTKPATGWVHPGLKPKRFFEKGLKELKKEFRNMMQVNIKKKLGNG